MRSMLIACCPVLVWCFSALQLGFLVISLIRYSKTKNTLFLLTGLEAAGLFYDALIISLGSVLNDGALLRGLSQVRFISHGALIPLLLPICFYALGWKKLGKTIGWIVTGLIMALGIAEGFATVIELSEIAGVSRFTAGAATPAWAESVSSLLSFGTVIPLMIAGIIVWVKQKTPTLFLSGFLMFAFSALGPATGNTDLIFIISMFGEALMVLFFLLYGNYNASERLDSNPAE